MGLDFLKPSLIKFFPSHCQLSFLGDRETGVLWGDSQGLQPSQPLGGSCSLAPRPSFAWVSCKQETQPNDDRFLTVESTLHFARTLRSSFLVESNLHFARTYRSSYLAWIRLVQAAASRWLHSPSWVSSARSCNLVRLVKGQVFWSQDWYPTQPGSVWSGQFFCRVRN